MSPPESDILPAIAFCFGSSACLQFLRFRLKIPLRWEVSHLHLSRGSCWAVAGEGDKALSFAQSLPSSANSLAEEKGKIEKVQISVEWGWEWVGWA